MLFSIIPQMREKRNRNEVILNNSQNHIPVMKSIPETAALFGVSQHLCRQLALSGKVKAVRVGGVRSKILVNLQSMSEYFDSCRLREDEECCSVLRPIPVKISGR